MELNAEPIAVLETAHDGPMPPSASFVRCSAPGVIVAVVKRAEAGEALVVRAHEAHGAATETRIELPHWRVGWDAAFRAGELKTWRIEPDGSVRETDLLEGLEAEPG
jgi:alpha-mannosidase